MPPAIGARIEREEVVMSKLGDDLPHECSRAVRTAGMKKIAARPFTERG
jgi:hypothetical protein